MSPDDNRFRELFEAIDEGYCLCEMIVDDNGAPVDYRFLETNALFESMTGLHDAVGKTALEMVPGLESHWVETYARAALGGERVRFEQGSAAMGRWFDVFAMPVGGDRQFAIVFKDETAQKETELRLQASEARALEMAARERHISLRLQQALLPDVLVEHPDLDIAAHYHADDDTMDVGGDWYDTILWPSGQVGIVVGDVSGHDIEAAAAMGRLRSGTKALAMRGPATPSAVLEALQTCSRGPDGTEMVTAFVLVIDLGVGRVQYASAGHPPAMLVTGGSVARLDQTNGPPVGSIFPVADFDHASVEFPVGSAVVLYTDGLIERRGDVIDDGLDFLERSIAASDRLDPDLIIDAMSASGSPQDDVVVVSVKRRAAPAPQSESPTHREGIPSEASSSV